MAIDIPFKILEIHVFSAQYLPPVSKMLRTFAVAWINPDHKLSTRIDHHGHTNPTWNYKLVFRVEDRFLRSDRAALTVEIYNVAWLRDLPVGTAHLMINQISPPLVLNSPTIRTVSLNISRPSGHMQGVLNIGVNILDNGNPSWSILSPRELSALRIGNDQDQVEEININNGRSSIDEKMKVLEDEFSKAKAANKSEKSSQLDNNSNNNNDHSDLNWRTKSVGSTAASQMKPLPSEVAANLKKGFYSTATGDDYGSSIFDNWTEETDNEKRDEFLRSRRNAMLMNDIHDQNHQLIIDHDHQEHNKQRIKPKQRNRSGGGGGGGLFSCFGKGFEFTLICGNSNVKRKRKSALYPRKASYRFSYPEDDLRRFYT